MSGYLFAFNDEDTLFEAMHKGRYSTLMKAKWGPAHLSTLGDYMTMRPGDRVYFFSKRMVYGIGEIVALAPDAVVVENRDSVTRRGTLGVAGPDELLILDDPAPPDDEDDRRVYRWVVAFQASPFMFTRGIDMDDLLTSNRSAFRSLRVFERRSFIELDDEEEVAFRTALLRRNADVLRDPSAGGVLEHVDISEHDRIHRILQSGDRKPKTGELVATFRKRDGSVSSEAALELALIRQLWTERDQSTTAVFGDWDYISHQVAASPAKSVQYMDRMDVFGYRWLDPNDRIIERYFVVELKKDTVRGEDLQQLMKYVDWVKEEYANGDYSLISAFLVGHDVDDASVRAALPTAERHSLHGYRPPVPSIWLDVTLVRYAAEPNGHVAFSETQVDAP